MVMATQDFADLSLMGRSSGGCAPVAQEPTTVLSAQVRSVSFPIVCFCCVTMDWNFGAVAAGSTLVWGCVTPVLLHLRTPLVSALLTAL